MLHLVAMIVNAKSYEDAEIVITVAEKDHNGEWRQTFGAKVIYPFWTLSFEALTVWDRPLVLPTEIPDGWVEHIQAIARSQVRGMSTPKVDLTTALGIKPRVEEPLKRRSL